MLTINATNARNKWFNLVDSVVRGSEIVTINTKNGNAVMLSQDEYSSLLETSYLYSNADYRQSIIDSLNEPLSEGTPLAEVNWDEI